MDTKARLLLKAGSVLFLVSALVIVVASLLNISLFFLELKNEIPNSKISFSVDYLHKSAILDIKIPVKNTGFLPLRLSVKTEILFPNGSVLGAAEDSRNISPGESKTMNLTVRIEENKFIKVVENPNEKIKTIFSFEIRTFFDLIGMNMSTPINLGDTSNLGPSTGG